MSTIKIVGAADRGDRPICVWLIEGTVLVGTVSVAWLVRGIDAHRRSSGTRDRHAVLGIALRLGGAQGAVCCADHCSAGFSVLIRGVVSGGMSALGVGGTWRGLGMVVARVY